jgi:hypothetical protein
MSRFEREWQVVPEGARWTAVFLGLVYTAAMAGVFLLPALREGHHRALAHLVPLFFLTLLGLVPLAVLVLLIGYVWADAKRRRMNHVLWTLLAIFIPNAIGIILYFILRDPVPVPCPACGAPTTRAHAYCPACGTPIRRACPQCRQAVEAGWRNCASCGAALSPPGGAVASG